MHTKNIFSRIFKDMCRMYLYHHDSSSCFWHRDRVAVVGSKQYNSTGQTCSRYAETPPTKNHTLLNSIKFAVNIIRQTLPKFLLKQPTQKALGQVSQRQRLPSPSPHLRGTDFLHFFLISNQ